MASEEGKVKIDKFNGKDFGFWKMQIEDYLYQKKITLTSDRGETGDYVQSGLGSIRLTSSWCDLFDANTKCGV